MSLVEENIVNFDPVLRDHRAAMAALRENLDRLKKTLAGDDDFSSAPEVSAEFDGSPDDAKEVRSH